DRETMALARIDADSGRLDWLRVSDWDLTLLSVSRDGQRLAVVENVEGYSTLHVLATDTLEAEPVSTLPPGVILDLAWRPDAKALAVTLSGATRNPDVWLVPVSGAPSSRVTHS